MPSCSMCRRTETYGFKITQEVRNPTENILDVRMAGVDTKVARTSRRSVHCAQSPLWSGQETQPGHTFSQRTLWLCPHCSVRSFSMLEASTVPLVICHLQAEHCAEPSWGRPRAQITSLFLSSVDWGLKSASVFSRL